MNFSPLILLPMEASFSVGHMFTGDIFLAYVHSKTNLEKEPPELGMQENIVQWVMKSL